MRTETSRRRVRRWFYFYLFILGRGGGGEGVCQEWDHESTSHEYLSLWYEPGWEGFHEGEEIPKFQRRWGRGGVMVIYISMFTDWMIEGSQWFLMNHSSGLNVSETREGWYVFLSLMYGLFGNRTL